MASPTTGSVASRMTGHQPPTTPVAQPPVPAAGAPQANPAPIAQTPPAGTTAQPAPVPAEPQVIHQQAPAAQPQQQAVPQQQPQAPRVVVTSDQVIVTPEGHEIPASGLSWLTEMRSRQDRENAARKADLDRREAVLRQTEQRIGYGQPQQPPVYQQPQQPQYGQQPVQQPQQPPPAPVAPVGLEEDDPRMIEYRRQMDDRRIAGLVEEQVKPIKEMLNGFITRIDTGVQARQQNVQVVQENYNLRDQALDAALPFDRRTLTPQDNEMLRQRLVTAADAIGTPFADEDLDTLTQRMHPSQFREVALLAVSDGWRPGIGTIQQPRGMQSLATEQPNPAPAAPPVGPNGTTAVRSNEWNAGEHASPGQAGYTSTWRKGILDPNARQPRY